MKTDQFVISRFSRINSSNVASLSEASYAAFIQIAQLGEFNGYNKMKTTSFILDNETCPIIIAHRRGSISVITLSTQHETFATFEVTVAHSTKK